jgi:hypothetical protein
MSSAAPLAAMNRSASVCNSSVSRTSERINCGVILRPAGSTAIHRSGMADYASLQSALEGTMRVTSCHRNSRLSCTSMAGSTGHGGPWHLFAWPAAWSALQFNDR